MRHQPLTRLRKEKKMVFVLDKHKKPIMPCSEKRASLLLERKRAVVHKMEPFTIRLKDRTMKDLGSLYKIGSDWLFDSETLTGSKVIRAGNKPDSAVKSFEKAFVVEFVGTEYNIDCLIAVPVGIIRKALHILKLKKDGALD
jgi:hypothetical protein